MKKLFAYSEDELNQVFSYLINKPMLEVEKYVNILRKPAKVLETIEKESLEGQQDGNKQKEEIKES